MRVYFDTCTLQRPLDDRSQSRVFLEAEAILGLLGLCDQGTLQLVTSDIVEYETNNNANQQKKAFVEKIARQAKERITLTEEIEHLAHTYEQFGIKAIDALHLASAETVGVDYFCTCDDRFYRRAVQLPQLSLKMRMPLELAQEVII
jgi:predicted nucleic acid-binding protein